MGKQDQYAAAYGGLQFFQFNPDGTVFVDPIICKPETRRCLSDRLLMLYTGLTRSAPDILEVQAANINGSAEKRASLGKMVDLAHNLRLALQNDDLAAFGEVLNEGWERKRTLAREISNSQIDEWYARARAAGAAGGKLLGAGGGGFLLIYADEDRHPAIRAALSELRSVEFSFEPQGSKIIYVEEPAQTRNGLKRS